MKEKLYSKIRGLTFGKRIENVESTERNFGQSSNSRVMINETREISKAWPGGHLSNAEEVILGLRAMGRRY